MLVAVKHSGCDNVRVRVRMRGAFVCVRACVRVCARARVCVQLIKCLHSKP